MRRLWLRWALLIAFVVALGLVFVNLGEWQLNRLEQRRARNASTVANEANPIRPAAEVFTRPINDADQWQRVEARGTFDPEHQFVIRYRNAGELEGYEVVTPLRTDFGVLLVDRGFIAKARGGQIPATAPAPPVGPVTVTGHVRRNEQGRRNATTPVDGQVRLINSEAIGATLPYPVLNGYVGLLTVTPAQVGDFQPVALPEISEGPHFWYAVQWFMFTGLAVAGIFVFIRGDLRERREEAAKAAQAAESAAAGPPEPIGVRTGSGPS